MIGRDEFAKRFEEFITGVDPERSLAGVGPSDNLFDAGVLDSFTVAKVIIFLEHLVGGQIDLSEASIESFSTVDSIYETFVGHAAA